MSWGLWASAFTLGLLSAPHCAAMCGGIVSASQVGLGKRRLPQADRRAAILASQNAGRLASYTLAGALAGGVGQIAGRTTLVGARDALQIGAAVALLAAGLTLAGLLPARASLERLGVPLWRRLQPLGRRLLPIDTWKRGALFGMIWGFLPCGLVYSALSLSMLSGSLAGGAATMLAFGLGTAPAVVALGIVAGAIGSLARRALVRRTAGALIAAFGVLQLGLALQAMHARGADHACCHGHEVAVAGSAVGPE